MNIDSPEIFEIPPNSQGTSTLYIVSALYEEELYKYDFEDPNRIIL
ncbi:MAG: hypothetical protein LM581_03205 [Desulfurococcales archaeon]|jgi:gamma-glutamyltranspeptidase/glutathione hydrolase|nr:hypothetical protein [Desulfurococcales archaeon]